MAAAKEISVDAAAEAVLSELEAFQHRKKKMKTEQKDLLSGQHVPVLHLTGFAKNSVKLSGE